jgi:general secretion pathway protein N
VRVDGVGPRTWLLAATAGWALLAWFLALAGMGGRVAPLAEDEALLKTLPPLRAASPQRLGPLSQYGETAGRPLFADDRRPHPFSLQPEGNEAEAKAFDYVLTSVLITPDFKMAILQSPDGTQSLRVKLGEAPEAQPAWRLNALNARSAIFVGPEGERTLDLRVFNGVGGEPPTATTVRPSQPQQPVGVPIAPPPEAVAEANEQPGPQGPVAVPRAPPKPQTGAPAAAMTEQAQMDAIRKRIEARRAQLRQEAILEQQQQQKQQQPPPSPAK